MQAGEPLYLTGRKKLAWCGLSRKWPCLASLSSSLWRDNDGIVRFSGGLLLCHYLRHGLWRLQPFRQPAIASQPIGHPA